MAYTGLIWNGFQKVKLWYKHNPRIVSSPRKVKKKVYTWKRRDEFAFPFKLLADAHFKASHRKSNSGLK